jgi:endonuclease YncB( thermonuclease family)
MKMNKRLFTGLVAAAAMSTSIAVMANAPAEASMRAAKVVRWVDGDTVVTTRGTVRLIGVDTPEFGRCGAATATRLAKRLAPAGSRIRLVNPGSVQNQDKYARLLRYVNRGGTDVGLRQIKVGSVAKYDSRTGYDHHPRQSRYIRADRHQRNHKCSGGTGGDMAAYAPIAGTWDCPAKAPIKGNQGSPEWIYHLPRNAYYDATNPEECFATEAGAQAHGYRAAKI